MPKKSKTDLTVKFPININNVYPNLFKSRNVAIRLLVRNFTDSIDFISVSDRMISTKHAPSCAFFLTEQCSKELIRIGGAL